MIQIATKEDIWRIQKIVHTTWIPTYESILSDPQIYYMIDMMYSTAALEVQMDLGQEFYLYLSEQNQCLGYVSVQPAEDMSCLKIHKIYVDLNCQGGQIGKHLMSFVEQFAKEKTISKLKLNVNRNNKAIGFYERLGFEIESSEDIDIGKGYLMVDYVMTKNI